MIETIISSIGAGKSAKLLVEYHIAEFKGIKSALIKPAIDDRDGAFVKTRFGNVSEPCFLWREELIEELIGPDVKIIFIDEFQFLTNNQIEQIKRFSYNNQKVKIYCYGLLTDYLGKMFDGSKGILEISDNIVHLKNKCFCGRNAIYNAKLDEDGNVVKTPSETNIAPGYHYTALCSKHYHEGVSSQSKK